MAYFDIYRWPKKGHQLNPGEKKTKHHGLRIFSTLSLHVAGSNFHHNISDFHTWYISFHTWPAACSTGKCPVQHLHPKTQKALPHPWNAPHWMLLFPGMILELRHVSSNQSSRSSGHTSLRLNMTLSLKVYVWRPNTIFTSQFVLGHCHG